MPEIISLSAEARPSAGKGPARATRRAGRVPGIIYGDGKEPTPISLDPRELSRAIHRAGFFATMRLPVMLIGGNFSGALAGCARNVAHTPTLAASAATPINERGGMIRDSTTDQGNDGARRCRASGHAVRGGARERCDLACWTRGGRSIESG